MPKDQGLNLSQEDPQEKEMATHSSILAWRIPWTKELYSNQDQKRLYELLDVVAETVCWETKQHSRALESWGLLHWWPRGVNTPSSEPQLLVYSSFIGSQFQVCILYFLLDTLGMQDGEAGGELPDLHTDKHG